jgi:hypothetical protein
VDVLASRGAQHHQSGLREKMIKEGAISGDDYFGRWLEHVGCARLLGISVRWTRTACSHHKKMLQRYRSPDSDETLTS